MNNKIFSSLLCIMVLAFAPACKRKSKAVKPDTKITIELDNTILEIEEFDAENDQKAHVKF